MIPIMVNQIVNSVSVKTTSSHLRRVLNAGIDGLQVTEECT